MPASLPGAAATIWRAFMRHDAIIIGGSRVALSLSGPDPLERIS